MKYKKKPLADLLRADRTVFTFQDICLLWGSDSQRAMISAVNHYVRTGDLIRLRRGIYARDHDYDRLELASRIYTPAYVSFETVLKEEGLIFQYYETIFAASYLSRLLEIDSQAYQFHKLKQSVLVDPVGINHKQGRAVATLERAFLDTLYINRDYHFDNLNPVNWERVFEILPIYQNKQMEKRVNRLYNEYRSN
ncbi:MAG TPA: hypothetical protein ENN77_02795 [Candidatus Wirthbacteria bacterium]|nr:hypothetical protein [Candidatus Wirthbacteria bacterium]